MMRSGPSFPDKSSRAWTHKRASVSQVLGGSSGPDIAVAGVDPRRPSHLVVGKRAHDGGVGGQRNRATLSCRVNAFWVVSRAREAAAERGESGPGRRSGSRS